MTEQICECGLTEEEHIISCKKFKAQSPKGDENHSPQVFNAREPPADTPSRQNTGEGTQNHPELRKAIDTIVKAQNQQRLAAVEKSLSDKGVMGLVGEIDYPHKDVKEAVKRLKKHFNLPGDHRVIDKIMGDNLI